MKFTELQEEFLLYLERQRGCSRNTLRTYRSAFHSLLKASAEIGVPEPDTESVDRRWANRLVQQLGRSLRPRTVHRDITAWRSMLHYAVEEGYTTQNPLQGVRLPKKDPVERVPVTSEDVQALLQATWRLLDRRRGCMARALLLTAATAATRYSDLMPLELTDLNLADGLLTIRHGKGNKSRTIPLPTQTVEALVEWLQFRREWLATWPRRADGLPEDGKTGKPRAEPTALWLADRGRPFGEDGLRKLLRELCLLAGLDREIRLHDLRHSAATRMARQGMPLVGIQAVLGHTNLTTTQGYIAGSGPHLQEWAEKMGLPSAESPAGRASASARGSQALAPAIMPTAVATPTAADSARRGSTRRSTDSGGGSRWLRREPCSREGSAPRKEGTAARSRMGRNPSRQRGA